MVDVYTLMLFALWVTILVALLLSIKLFVDVARDKGYFPGGWPPMVHRDFYDPDYLGHICSVAAG